jgi:hypothetical protein
LVRESLREGDPAQALAWLDRARQVTTGPVARTFAVWSAEVLARTGRPDAAARTYRELLDRAEAGDAAAVALDGAETLLDNGYPDHALPLLLDARSRALASGNRDVVDAADRLLDRGRHDPG